jgi:hypothetical protein
MNSPLPPNLVASFPQTDGQVNAMCVSQGVLYIGGQFNNVGGLPRIGVAAISLLTGQVLPLNLSAYFSPSPQINALAVLNGFLYVGGYYNLIGNPSQNFSVFDIATGIAQSSNGWYANDIVKCIETDGTYVYIGGAFTQAGPAGRNGAAKFLGSNPESWNPNVGGPSFYVADMAVSGDTVYMAGQFSSVGGQTRNNAAAVQNDAAGTILPWNPNLSALAQAVAVGGGSVYVGGTFNTVNGSVTQNALASFDLVNGTVTPGFLGQVMDNPFAAGEVVGIQVVGQYLYIGGQFQTIGTQPATNMAVLSLPTGAFVAAANFDSGVNALLLLGPNLFLGGNFSNYTNPTPQQPVSYLAELGIQPGLPQAPTITFLNRSTQGSGPSLTMLRWAPVVLDANSNPTTVSSYNVYRTSSANLEDPEVVFSVTTLDVAGAVDTFFTEQIDGFYKYCVSAVNSAGEGPMTCAFFSQTPQLERLGGS